MKISLGSLTLPSAALGPDSPLPPLGGPALVTVPADLSAADPEMARNLAYGRPRTLLPYTVQDGYTRNLADTALRTAVVENELIRAEFLLDYGGRLWSLWDKAHKRELLHRNPVLQPGNLALRNALLRRAIRSVRGGGNCLKRPSRTTGSPCCTLGRPAGMAVTVTRP